IVKVINTSGKPQPVSLYFDGLKEGLREGTCIRLQSAELERDNTLEQPSLIYPQESRVTINGKRLDIEIEPYTFILYKLLKSES
ncbi:MAG: alpha-L-arabinofuranosidase, partial [Dysgonamonadaceae bacterium]|nr:alpha-L-arabinofuranosidase [Dysgonamonadaceae bacterium]